MRRFTALLLCCVGLMLFVPGALGAPANATLVPVECEGSSLTMVLVPNGPSKALWDASTENLSNGPNYLIKLLTQEVFVDGQSIGVATFSFGHRTGQGEPITCSYEEHFVDPRTGAQVDVYGTSYLVPR
jgi:hypothetical protein